MSTPFNLHTIYSSHQALPPLAFRSLRCGVHLLVHLKLEWMHKAECIPHQKNNIYGVNDMQTYLASYISSGSYLSTLASA